MVGAARFRVLKSIRARVLLAFIALIVLSGVFSMVAIQEVLVLHLTHRMEEAARQEVDELNRLVEQGVDPRTGKAFASSSAVFDVYFERNVPSREEAMLAFVDGRPYWQTMSRFALPSLPQPVMGQFATSAPDPAVRRLRTFDTELGAAYYATWPVRVGESFGTFVVVFLPVVERAEIARLQSYGVLAVIGVVLLASGAAWWVTGRLLGPVRSLTQTAQAISRSDLTGRIPVRSDDEAAEMARTFNAMLDRLEGVFQREREFLMDASHELRVPLTIALGNLSLIRYGIIEEPEEQRRTVALVMDELDRMSRLVNDLQMLADVKNPHFLQPEDIDLEAFTHELADKMVTLAPRAWHVDAASTGRVRADRHRLTEAVINLAQNAVQNTEPGSLVAVGTSLSTSECRIWVRDAGPGVSAEDLPHIFERFRRGAAAHLRYRGSGVGLSIVRAIAEAHGGRVEVSSPPDEGATFALVLPARVPGGGRR
ncbi:sensor histidine kinase [Asanoa siamensis]|uniref:histidine kinase n=1 Tax=Asanoa siamensis TaxID=926357 RepID=A0ABQ4CUL4_9ACTN|nr:ATP-binding protein [Asanoa siamensis]GIF74972.1 two-component sensor histidine kinase [Asanoa siamensis]